MGDLQTPGDRAAKRRKTGLIRILVHQLGFHEGNRGGLGIAPTHVHEIAEDGCSNGIKLSRYQHVDVVRMSGENLQRTREANRLRCAADPLMPAFSPNIEFICLTKTHFAHALKLDQQGGRSLYNQGKVPIIFPEHLSAEILEIRNLGVLCTVYDESILEDKAALLAVMGDDNLNANVQMREHE